uniref:Calcium-independent protein kinase C n=1 Tax=Magallana gigas TaxID=29159 RepID=K1Q2T6_MAGGI
MKFFNGSMTLKICEAHDLKPTDCSTRHQIAKGALLIDPYISVDVDDNEVARTTTKTKTLTPVWNENFVTEVHNGRTIGLTVFHDAAIPPDDFVANCSIPFEEIKEKTNDLWVDLEPNGQIHIVLELQGSTSEGVFGIKAINVKCAHVWFTNAAIKVLLLNVQAPKRMVVKR